MNTSADVFTSLRKAALRVEDWLAVNDIRAVWSLDSIGLKLRADFGQKTMVQIVSWTHLSESGQDADHLLMLIEQRTLHELTRPNWRHP